MKESIGGTAKTTKNHTLLEAQIARTQKFPTLSRAFLQIPQTTFHPVEQKKKKEEKKTENAL